MRQGECIHIYSKIKIMYPYLAQTVHTSRDDDNNILNMSTIQMMIVIAEYF